MASHMNRRTVLGTMVAGWAAPAVVGVAAAADEAAPRPGQLTTEGLGAMLKAAGLSAKLLDKRYDFVYKTKVDDQDWDLSFSAVLSQDNETIWIMAWLEELPKSAADVPRTALLRLLSDNDNLGNGKFFAYVAGNRRFVLQRVLENDRVSIAAFKDDMEDLAQSVVETYPHWNVKNWSQNTTDEPANTTSQPSPAAQSSQTNASAAAGRAAVRAPQSAGNDSKFNTGSQR